MSNKRTWADISAELTEEAEAKRAEYATRYECKHDETEYRRAATSAGQLQLRKQCLKCRELVGTACRRDSVPDFNAVPMVDEMERQRSQRRWDDYSRFLETQKERRNQAFWDLYNTHLRSPEWREKCAAVHRRAADLCEGCGKHRPRHVHHRTYDHLGDEFLFELVALCLDCHQRIHPHREIA